MSNKQPVTERILAGLQSRGLRSKLLHTTENGISPALAKSIDDLTTGRPQPNTIQARVLLARIMANALKADGSFPEVEPLKWKNLAATALDSIQGKGRGQKDAMLKRIVNCVSLPLDKAAPHIFALASMLQSKGLPLNYLRLYFDLLDWDNKRSRAKLLWATQIAPLQ